MSDNEKMTDSAISDSYNDLRKALKIFDINDFYVITVYENEIMLQGFETEKIISDCEKNGFEKVNRNNGFLQYQKNRVQITLTEPFL